MAPFPVFGHTDLEFYAFNARFLPAVNMQAITAKLELFQFELKIPRIHAQINQRAEEHVAADAAEEVKVERFHFSANALIWLAA
jgi:hypothetical protein